MTLYSKLARREEKISVIGLGYVGLPLALSFAKYFDTVGFDTSVQKIEAYKRGEDPTGEMDSAAMQASLIDYTSDASKLKEAKFHIIAVPTPIDAGKKPDLAYLESASVLLGGSISRGSVVVFESTVYPGVTEDVCVPIIEQESGLKCGVDFKIGYSPERINPGDKVNTFETIVKVVAGMDAESLEDIAQVYETAIPAGVHRVSSIKVAEAVKVIENTQRDVNIAFMNEVAILLSRMDINSCEVVGAMNTKWNALGFSPGLVGGHCIGVDPYYLMYEVERMGIQSRIIRESRRVNEIMSGFVCEAIIRNLSLASKTINKAKVAILGLTFKENTADIRNSKIADLYTKLKKFGIDPIVVDPIAIPEEAKQEFDITLTPFESLHDLDCVVVTVAHEPFIRMSMDDYDKLFKRNLSMQEKVIIDVKCVLCKKDVQEKGYRYWHM